MLVNLECVVAASVFCRYLVADIRRMKNMLVDQKLVDEDAAKSARYVNS